MPRLTASTLPLAIGFMEILLGTAMLIAVPAAFAEPGRRITVAGTAYVSAGVIACILHVHGPGLGRRVRLLGSLLVAAPLLGSAWNAWRIGVSGGVVVFGLLAPLYVLAGWQDDPRDPEPVGLDALVCAVLLVEAALGALLLAAPGTFRHPLYAQVLPIRPLVAGALLTGAAALALSLRLRNVLLRLAAYLVGAVPLVGLGVLFVRALGWWPGLFVYPMLAAFLVAHPWFQEALADRVRAAAARPSTAAVERIIEAVVWAAILLVTLAGNMAQAPVNRVGLYSLAFAASLFTLVWFRLRPGPNPRLRTLYGNALYTIFVALTARFTGGLHSPLFFLYYLPILATAWTLAPRDIRVPAGIGVVSMGLEAALAVRGGAPLGEVAGLAVFRVTGVLFVAVFAYLLSRRAVEQRALRRQERERLEAILANMAEGLVVLDQAGRIALLNRGAERLVEGSAAAVTGKPFQEVFRLQRENGGPFRDVDHPVTAALRRGQATRQRVLVRRASGDLLPVSLTASPFYDPAGGALGVICTLQDVRVEVEMERMREDFFYIASHEIRTPLTVIKGNIELALDGSLGALSDGVRRVLGEVHEATVRLIRLVNDFLNAARLEHGKITLHIERGHLPEVVGQVIETLAPDARRKGLTLTYRLPEVGTLPAVLLDPEKAIQVLLNLVGNGIKFTERGGVEIWHEVRDGLVETHIRDTGPGIPADQRHRLFERFSQLGRGLTRDPGGSGLGLYISLKLAERMNGTVYLRASEPGGGSTFVFALPVAAEEERRAWPRPPAVSERTGTR
jgi:PAS domain S-box-containing protein